MSSVSHETDRFAGPMFLRALAPALISSVGLGVADVADAVVLGQRMGETGLAAISLALPVYMVINLIMHGFGSGGSIRYSRLLGEGNHQEGNRSFSSVLETSLVIGILLALAGNLMIHPLLAFLGAVPENEELYRASRVYIEVIVSGIPLFFCSYLLNYYLQADGSQKLASFGFTVGNLTDLLLNFLLVLVFDLGAAGAAWSTLAGQAAAVFIYLWSFKKPEREGILDFRLCMPDLTDVWSCYRLGFSTSSQYIFQMVFLLIANRVLMEMGGENGVAVFDLVQNTSFLILYLYNGVSRAAQPLIGTFVGECSSQGLRRTLRLGYRWGLMVGGLGALFVFLFPQALCALFGIQTAEALSLGSYALRVLAFGSLFAGAAILTESFCQAGEDEQGAFLIAALRGALILIPCALIFSMIGLRAFWWMYPATEILTLLVYGIWKKYFKKAKPAFKEERVYSCTIRGQNDSIRPLTQGIDEFLERWEAKPSQQYFVAMAAEEICLLIMEKGFVQGETGYIQITLVALEDGDFELHIRDDAVKFNPFSLKTTRADQGEDWDPDAIGILVIKEKSKDFFYRRYQGFNTMVIRI